MLGIEFGIGYAAQGLRVWKKCHVIAIGNSEE